MIHSATVAMIEEERAGSFLRIGATGSRPLYGGSTSSNVYDCMKRAPLKTILI